MEVIAYALSIWMLYDAFKRKAEYYWLLLILFLMPVGGLGGLLYFFFVKFPETHKLQENGEASAVSIGQAAPAQAESSKPNINHLREVVAQTPSLENRVSLAQALFAAGQFSESLGLFEDCVAADNEDREILYGLGRCYAQQGNHTKAIEMFSRVIDVDRSFHEYDPWLDLSAAYHANGDADRSVRVLEKLVLESPRLKHKTILGRILIRHERFGEAERILREAIQDFTEASFFLKHNNAHWIREAKELHDRIKEYRVN